VDNNEKLAYMERIILGALCVLLAYVAGLFSRSFLPSSMQEKGKDPATKEDLQELARQTGILAQTTQEIEARISIGAWSQQQRWDVQKTALLESLKELATAETFLVRLVHVFADTKDHPQGWEARRKEANEKYAETINNFWRTQLAMEIVCGREIGNQFQKIDDTFKRVLNRVKQGDFKDIWDTQFPLFFAEKGELGETIRRKFGFDAEVEGEIALSAPLNPPSRGPSAVPSLDPQAPVADKP
jgi:hypothetical protein